MAPRLCKVTPVAGTSYGYNLYWLEKAAWCFQVHHANGDLTGVHGENFATATEALHAAVLKCGELERQYASIQNGG